MGSDDLHHKRKARKIKTLQRKQASRRPYKKLLIVCEGSKTEPNYFEGLKSFYKISGAVVKVSGKSGSSPASIFKFAQDAYDKEREAGDPYDRVYCVFDKDTHSCYQDTCERIGQAKPAGRYVAITSVPCFEYWLLLHYTYTTSAYYVLPGSSPANQVLSELKNYFPDYSKNDIELFSGLQDKLEFAKNNARRGLRQAESNYTDNPSTKVHELVEYLQAINQ